MAFVVDTSTSVVDSEASVVVSRDSTVVKKNHQVVVDVASSILFPSVSVVSFHIAAMKTSSFSTILLLF